MERSDSYFKFYNQVLLLKVSLPARVVLSIFLSFFEAGKTVFMGDKKLSNMIGVSERQIRRYLTELENAHLIHRVNRNGQRVFSPGSKCPVSRTNLTKSYGQGSPSAQDRDDQILESMNRRIQY